VTVSSVSCYPQSYITKSRVARSPHMDTPPPYVVMTGTLWKKRA